MVAIGIIFVCVMVVWVILSMCRAAAPPNAEEQYADDQDQIEYIRQRGKRK